jgi:hypothetical protein
MRGGFVALPKAEVHVHLEGCFEIDDIVGLARENGVPYLDRMSVCSISAAGWARFWNFSTLFAGWCARRSSSLRRRGDFPSAWPQTAHAMPI